MDVGTIWEETMFAYHSRVPRMSRPTSRGDLSKRTYRELVGTFGERRSRSPNVPADKDDDFSKDTFGERDQFLNRRTSS